MTERERDGQTEERRALVADLVRTQAILQARSEQLQRIFSSRWYRLARFFWRARRPWAWRSSGGPPRPAGEGSFAQPLNGAAAAAEIEAAAGEPVPGLEPSREAAAGRGEPGLGEPRPRLLIAGHSLDFAAPIATRMRAADATVREDRWRAHGTHDAGRSAAALAWADVVHCEWCLGNAAWYSRNKRPAQRLVVRFHRMELETGYPGEVELGRVDAIAFVARHVLEEACERFGWDPGDPRFHVVPNGVDSAALARPKLPGAEHTLAVVGYVPRLKRLDRALDLLERLRGEDERWRLLVKGREPWEHARLAGGTEEREHFAGLVARLDATPALRAAVEFEPFGEDLPDFLRRAGWIVSSGAVEGHSVALAEAMASGAVPVVLDRRGAAEQCQVHWIHADVEAAAAAVAELSARGEVEAEAALARRHAARWDWERLGPVWERLLLGTGAHAKASPAGEPGEAPHSDQPAGGG